MNDIVVIFLIMLLILTVMSAFGGGIRYRENFYQELALDHSALLDENSYLSAEDMVSMNENTPIHTIQSEDIVFNSQPEPSYTEPSYTEPSMMLTQPDQDMLSSQSIPQPPSGFDTYDLVEAFDGDMYHPA